jgi:hypothetical protein
LIIPSDLLHHSILQVCRLNTLILNKLLDLTKRHDTVSVSTLSLLARTGKVASKSITALVRDGVTTTVHSETEVDLLGVKTVEPERNGVIANLTDVGLAANDLAESSDIRVPRTVEI